MRVVPLVVLTASCAVACVTIPDSPRKLGPDGGSGGSSGAGGAGGSSGASGSAGASGAGGVPIPDSGQCPSWLKPCGELCVEISDPAYGCSPAGCDPCPSVDRATSHECVAEACAVAGCAPGHGDCNGVHADGCEHDTSSDSSNCGACAWDCGGTTCAGGLCAAMEIVKGLHATSEILIDESSVYVPQLADKGVIVTAKDGTPKAGPATGWVHRLAQDATHLYIGTDTGIRRWPKAGGAVETLTTTSNVVDSLIVDDTDVWWAEWQTTPLAQIRRASKTTPGSSVEVHSQTQRIRELVDDGTTLYFTSASGEIGRLPLAGGTVETGLDTGSNAWGITIAGSTMYWRCANAVLSAPSTGDTATLLFPGQSSPGGIAHADQLLFWTTSSSVVSGDPVTKLQRTLAATKTASRGMTVDSEFVYWTTFTAYGDKTGGAFRVRRPPP